MHWIFPLSCSHSSHFWFCIIPPSHCCVASLYCCTFSYCIAYFICIPHIVKLRPQIVKSYLLLHFHCSSLYPYDSTYCLHFCRVLHILQYFAHFISTLFLITACLLQPILSMFQDWLSFERWTEALSPFKRTCSCVVCVFIWCWTQ